MINRSTAFGHSQRAAEGGTSFKRYSKENKKEIRTKKTEQIAKLGAADGNMVGKNKHFKKGTPQETQG